MNEKIRCEGCHKDYPSLGTRDGQGDGCATYAYEGGTKMQSHYGSRYDSTVFLVNSEQPLKEGANYCDDCVEGMMEKRVLIASHSHLTRPKAAERWPDDKNVVCDFCHKEYAPLGSGHKQAADCACQVMSDGYVKCNYGSDYDTTVFFSEDLVNSTGTMMCDRCVEDMINGGEAVVIIDNFLNQGE